LIIAAGKGSRIAHMGHPKPLLPVDGVPLIERAVESAYSAGVRDFVVVTGYRSQEIDAFVSQMAREKNLSIETVFNRDFEKENGLSVLCAKEKLNEPFFLVMADHVVDSAILKKLKHQPHAGDEVILAVDYRTGNNPNVDMDDVTRVLADRDLIMNIGKTIPDYNAFDTGIFLCTPAIFNALEESAADGDSSLSGGILKLAARKKAKVMDIEETWWIDVDDEATFQKAEALLQKERLHKQKTGTFKRAAKIFLTLGGFLLLAYLVQKIGLGEIAANLNKFGYWFLLTCLLGTGWLFFQSLSWNIIQRILFRKVPLLKFFRIKVIGESLNTLLPSASIGGDAVRTMLVGKLLPLREGIPAILVDKTVEFIGGMVFMGTGLILAFITGQVPEAFMMPGILCVAVTLLGIALLIVIQFIGLNRMLLTATRLFPVWNRSIKSRQQPLQELDANLRYLYTQSSGRLMAAGLLHFLGRIMGAFEVWLILYVLEVPLGFVDAVFIAAMVTVVNTIFFLMPGQWGVSEGAHALLLQSLGFHPGLGLSIGIIRRLRRLVFVGIGLIFFQLEKTGKDHAPVAKGGIQ
jgi:uncharacterized protein (TIRG00374 family)